MKNYIKYHEIELRRNTTLIIAVMHAKYAVLYNNQINARALIGQSAVGYCAGKATEKSHVF